MLKGSHLKLRDGREQFIVTGTRLGAPWGRGMEGVDWVESQEAW